MTLALNNLASALAPSTAAQKVSCAHCGQPVAAAVDAMTEQFCCNGCRVVYQTLNSCGLVDYYRLRQMTDAPTKPANVTGGRFESFDSDAFQKLYVRQHDGRATADLALEGLSCAACVWVIERLPRIITGVIEARLSFREATVRVTWDPEQVKLSRIAIAMDSLGYTPHPARDSVGKELHRQESRKRLIHLGIAGALSGNIMLVSFALFSGDVGHMEPMYRNAFRWLSAGLGLLSLAWPGATFFRSAWAAIRTRTTNLDVPIAAALAVGGIAGTVNVVLNRGQIYFDSLAVLTFLLLVGRFIQYRQQRRADDAVGLLFSLTPSSCHIVRDDRVIDGPIEALKAGDLVEVRPGELMPADGIVEVGTSAVNQALLTGESMPVSVAPASCVHAGSQNMASLIRVRISAVGRDTRVGKLMRLVERGLAEKAPIVQFTDRVGGVFLVVVSAISILVFAYWARISLAAAIDHTIALLIVTCPCVLGLATPLSLAISIGKLARRDILVKSGTAIERLAGTGELLLDKTGTLTEGRMQLVQWTGAEKWRAAIADVERHSNHPVGRALHQTLSQNAESPAGESDYVCIERGDGGIIATSKSPDSSKLWNRFLVGSPAFAQRNGAICEIELASAIEKGQQAGATVIVAAADDVVVAVAVLGDKVRPDSASALARLRRFGWNPAMLSGDAPQVAARVAYEVGIEADRAVGQMSPEQKLARIHLHQDHQTVVMVGDGVNDAAALAAADVGIAVHGGAEASLAAADVYIARPGMAPLAELIAASRKTMRVIRRNLVVSLAYNILAGGLAAAGVMTPMIAAIIMPVSSATVLALAALSLETYRSSKNTIEIPN